VTATSTFVQDYETLNTGCGLVDRSERGKLCLTGGEAKAFLQGQLTNDTLSLIPGSGLYAAFLTPKGKMQGDLRVLDAGSELLLDTERVALQALFNMIRSFSLGYDVQLHKRTLESGLLSLIGPGSPAVLQAAGVSVELPEA
jgi:folate-binding Fe-S cluster repair protein YgfZ